MKIEAPVSLGELVDKVTILEIKLERFPEGEKRDNVRRELRALADTLDGVLDAEGRVALEPLKQKLARVNGELWSIEDDIRDCERAGSFGDRFIQLARRVYQTNDERSGIKRKINEAFGSDLKEEKSYSEY
jgi:hypothetical protein